MEFPRIAVSRPLLICALILAAPATHPWTSSLQRGGEIQIDPDTRRPILIENGNQTQLWDGIHRLDDGSTITVRDGRVVPTEGMLDPPSPPPQPTEEAPDANAPAGAEMPTPASDTTLDGTSPCEHLVIRVCGADRRCWREPPCVAARQLRDLEREERLRGADPAALEFNAAQCEEAEASDFFVPCP
jgi:hypothetical protein